MVGYYICSGKIYVQRSNIYSGNIHFQWNINIWNVQQRMPKKDSGLTFWWGFLLF